MAEAAKRASDLIDQELEVRIQNFLRAAFHGPLLRSRKKLQEDGQRAAEKSRVSRLYAACVSTVFSTFFQVMLLGQAESGIFVHWMKKDALTRDFVGKSTLQKQFQLYHASHTLESERSSWKIVVYTNLIKAVRTILEELDYEFSLSLDEYPCPSEGPGPTDIGAQNEILGLRRNLLPLISLEDSLTSELGDGVSYVGHRRGTLFPGRQGVFARASSRPVTDLHGSSKALIATNRVAQILGTTVHVIEALWRHRSVECMLRLRKLRLDESGLLFVPLSPPQRVLIFSTAFWTMFKESLRQTTFPP
jgi:hypothetical protein